jgi:hypothetical protein
LLPYVQEAEQKKERKRKWLQPIQLVFDILSRGQYMTANVAKQITRNLREGRPALEGVPREAWQGIAGKEKGDWSTVLWGGEEKGGEQFQGWGQKWGEKLEKTWGGRRLKGGLALAGNILLDPTTYIGFGPATGAKTAAREATEDVVKIATKRLAAELTEKAAGTAGKELGEAAAKEVSGALLSKNLGKIKSTLGKLTGRNIDREMSEIIRATQKTAKRLPAPQLRQQMLGQAEDVAKRLEDATLEVMARGGRPYAEAIDVIRGEAPVVSDLTDLIKKLKGESAYTGAGTRALRFMRKEFAVGERYPAALKAWDKAGEWFKQSKIGSLFNSAYWATITNPKSPVALFR